MLKKTSWAFLYSPINVNKFMQSGMVRGMGIAYEIIDFKFSQKWGIHLCKIK